MSKLRYYRGYTIRNHGYYPPDKCILWEAINDNTGCADFHAHRLSDIIKMINDDLGIENDLPKSLVPKAEFLFNVFDENGKPTKEYADFVEEQMKKQIEKYSQ